MNLQELKAMIKEEYANYNEAYSVKVKEQAAPPAPPAVDVAPEDIDATGGDENPEETLRDIYDMLKDYFEGGDAGAADAPIEMGDDVDGDGDVDADDKKADDEEDEDDDGESLQERFKKLANIIKG